jgi:hypothetical protein
MTSIGADDVGVEIREVSGRDPVLQDGLAADLVDLSAALWQPRRPSPPPRRAHKGEFLWPVGRWFVAMRMLCLTWRALPRTWDDLMIDL